jgi:hypothetical protein
MTDRSLHRSDLHAEQHRPLQSPDDRITSPEEAGEDFAVLMVGLAAGIFIVSALFAYFS